MSILMPNYLNKPLKELPFVILDLETTGFDPISAGITEIAMISINGSNEEVFEMLINPECRISSKITQLTGITHEMTKNQPTIKEVISIIDDILSNTIFVSHNVPFDWLFIAHFVKRYLKKPLEMPSLCTLNLSRTFLDLNSNKLENVAKHFNVNLTNAHRAMNDTRATKEILLAFLELLDKKGIKTGKDLWNKNVIYKTTPPRR